MTVRFRTTFHNTIYDVFRARGWRETDSDTAWDVAWVDTGGIRENFDTMHLEQHQRINHFRNHYELTRKDSMNKNLKRMQRALQREDRVDEARKYDFFPNTTALPHRKCLLLLQVTRLPAPTACLGKTLALAQRDVRHAILRFMSRAPR